MHFDDLMYENHKYSRWGAYAQSKLAILLFTAELNRRLPGSSTTLALAAHPGVAKTKLGQNGGGIIGIGFQLTAPLIAHSALKGALPALCAAFDPEAKGGDFFGPRYGVFGSPALETQSAAARNMEDAKRLWEASERLTKKEFLPLL
jgi:NAD(P)-dependent dehydrogenase (short-subunit alcohol dehydrogenase family)